MKTILSVFAALLCSGLAQASTNGPGSRTGSTGAVTVQGATYSCNLSGEIAGASIGVFLGGEYISGPGMITCRSGSSVRSLPVRMKLVGFGPAFDLTIIKSIRVSTVDVGIVGGPEAFIHSYSIGGTAGATLINQGVEFDAAVKVAAAGGLTFELGLQGRDVLGLGAHLYGMAFSIEPM